LLALTGFSSGANRRPIGGLDAGRMIDNGSHLDVLRILVLVQGAIVATTAVEALVGGVAMGAMGPAVLTGGAALLTLALYARLGRRSRRAHTTLRWLQIGWVAFGVIDLVAALLLARRGLGPVAMLVRFLLPIAILRLARRTAPMPEPTPVMQEVAA
jgi:hypothetical protein